MYNHKYVHQMHKHYILNRQIVCLLGQKFKYTVLEKYIIAHGV